MSGYGELDGIDVTSEISDIDFEEFDDLESREDTSDIINIEDILEGPDEGIESISLTDELGDFLADIDNMNLFPEKSSYFTHYCKPYMKVRQ